MSINPPDTMGPVLCLRPGAVATTIFEPQARPLLLLDLTDGPEPAGDLAAVLDGLGARDFKGQLFFRLPVRSSPPETLARLARLKPDGFVVTACGAAADIQECDARLRVVEAESGLQDGRFALMAEVGAQPGFFLSGQMLRGVSTRLCGLVYDGARLQGGLATLRNAPQRLARAIVVLTAAQAGIASFDLLPEELLSDDAIAAWRDDSLADGFTAVVARNEAQRRICESNVV